MLANPLLCPELGNLAELEKYTLSAVAALCDIKSITHTDLDRTHLFYALLGTLDQLINAGQAGQAGLILFDIPFSQLI